MPLDEQPPGTATASTTADGHDRQRPAERNRRLSAGRLVALLMAAVLGTAATVQAARPLPSLSLTTTIATAQSIPGTMPRLPWPHHGSAELFVEGAGRLGGSGPGRPEPIGSVAKVMTAYVILKDHPLDGTDDGPVLTMTATDVADYRSRIPTNQSQVPITAGQRITQRDALEALMLPSANNIAHKLALWDAGSEQAFVKKMNAAATELGLTDTVYTDPSGFLPSTISTAADQVTLARAALAMPSFAEIVELRRATIPGSGSFRNYNDLLGVAGVFGIKTGSTTEAGGNLLFAARLPVGDRKVIVVGAVFHQPGADTPRQLATVNKVVERLLTAASRVVTEHELLAAAPVGRLQSSWGASATVTPAAPLTVTGWPGLVVPVRVVTAIPNTDVIAGAPVGTVEAAGVRVPLHADAPVTEPSAWWRLTRQ